MNEMDGTVEQRMTGEEQPVFQYRGVVDGRKYARAMRSVYLRRVLITGAVVLVAVILTLLCSSVSAHIPFFWDAFTEYGPTLVFLAVLYAFYAVCCILVFPQRAKSRFAEISSGADITVRLYEDRVESEEDDANHSGKYTLAFADVRRRILVTSQVIVLYRRRRSGITIYKSMIPAEDIPRVIAFLKARCPQRKA